MLHKSLSLACNPAGQVHSGCAWQGLSYGRCSAASDLCSEGVGTPSRLCVGLRGSCSNQRNVSSIICLNSHTSRHQALILVVHVEFCWQIDTQVWGDQALLVAQMAYVDLPLDLQLMYLICSYFCAYLSSCLRWLSFNGTQAHSIAWHAGLAGPSCVRCLVPALACSLLHHALAPHVQYLAVISACNIVSSFVCMRWPSHIDLHFCTFARHATITTSNWASTARTRCRITGPSLCWARLMCAKCLQVLALAVPFTVLVRCTAGVLTPTSSVGVALAK